MKKLIMGLVLLSNVAMAENNDIVRDWVNNWSRPTYTGNYNDRGFIPQDNTFQNQQPPAERRGQNCTVVNQYDFASGTYIPTVVCQ